MFVSSDDSEDDVSHPVAAAIARDRAVPKNPSENPKKKRSSEKLLKKISNSVRLQEFPNEYLEPFLRGVQTVALGKEKCCDCTHSNEEALGWKNRQKERKITPVEYDGVAGCSGQG